MTQIVVSLYLTNSFFLLNPQTQQLELHCLEFTEPFDEQYIKDHGGQLPVTGRGQLPGMGRGELGRGQLLGRGRGMGKGVQSVGMGIGLGKNVQSVGMGKDVQLVETGRAMPAKPRRHSAKDYRHPVHLFSFYTLLDLVSKGVTVERAVRKQNEHHHFFFLSQVKSVKYGNEDVALLLLRRAAIQLSRGGLRSRVHAEAWELARRGGAGVFTQSNWNTKFCFLDSGDELQHFVQQHHHTVLPCGIISMKGITKYRLVVQVKENEKQKIVFFNSNLQGVQASYDHSVNIQCITDTLYQQQQHQQQQQFQQQQQQQQPQPIVNCAAYWCKHAYVHLREAEAVARMRLNTTFKGQAAIGGLVRHNNGKHTVACALINQDSTFENAKLLFDGVCTLSSEVVFDKKGVAVPCLPFRPMETFMGQLCDQANCLNVLERKMLLAEQVAITKRINVWAKYPPSLIHTTPLVPRVPSRKRIILIDNSNIWISGINLKGKLSGLLNQFGQQDPVRYYRPDYTWRMDYKKILQLVYHDPSIDPQPRLCGSTIPTTDLLYRRIQQCNIEAFLFPRNAQNKEKGVDSMITLLISGVLTQPANSVDVVLFSGDRDFEPSVRHLLDNGYKVTICAFDNSTAASLKSMPGISFVCLDPYIDYITMHGLINPVLMASSAIPQLERSFSKEDIPYLIVTAAQHGFMENIHFRVMPCLDKINHVVMRFADLSYLGLVCPHEDQVVPLPSIQQTQVSADAFSLASISTPATSTVAAEEASLNFDNLPPLLLSTEIKNQLSLTEAQLLEDACVFSSREMNLLLTQPPNVPLESLVETSSHTNESTVADQQNAANESSLRLWLQGLHLEQYYDILMKNGYDDWKAIVKFGISEDDLEALVKIRGHRHRLKQALVQVRKLK